jgi:V8-like Glu-specific endopeptidase
VAALVAFAGVACGSQNPAETDSKQTGQNNSGQNGSGQDKSGQDESGKGDIIGDDDRRDEFSDEVTDKLRETARSTAMVVANETVVDNGGDSVSLASETLAESYFMCPGEAFRNQPIPGFCSAWLVAPDVMVTNGHCITSQTSCDESSFVFDYALSEEGQDLSSVPRQNVVACERVLAWDYTNDCDVDFAVVQLERPVEGRTPLDVRAAGEALDSDELVIIGHPFGLPRKYAFDGEVLAVGDNTFSTTHDIFGGNSGSAIFDADTGQVQGLVTCGGSNYDWEYWNEGWTLDTKTGQPCDQSCDDAGEYTDGTWEGVCTDDGMRRRCVCDDDQLVWEHRPCLPFEDETEGQCTREYQVAEETCRQAPWMCATPTMQHTAHLAHFVDSWQVYSHDEPVEIARNAAVTADITIDAPGKIQALSVYLDFIGEGDPADFDGGNAVDDLSVSIQRGDEEPIELVERGAYFLGTTYELDNVPSGSTEPLTVPFLLPQFAGQDISGTWTLRIKNGDVADYVIHDWRLQAVVKPDGEVAEQVAPCVEGCTAPDADWPPSIVESFDGGSAESVDHPQVSGTLAEGWQVEVLDESGSDYTVTKTARSQTLALTSGEFAIAKTFDEFLGGRDLTVDFRYDGEGWFQVWADDHIVFAKQGFTATTETVSLPWAASSIKVVIGASDDSRIHEATIYSLSLSPPPPAAE